MGQKALKPQRKQLLLEAGTRWGWRGWEGDKYPGSSLPPALRLASRGSCWLSSHLCSFQGSAFPDASKERAVTKGPAIHLNCIQNS